MIDPEESGWLLQVSKRFFEHEVDHLNRKLESRIIDVRLTVFPKDAVAALSMGSKEKGFLLKRLSKLDGQVALYSENYLLAELHDVVINSAIMTSRGSLNSVLRTLDTQRHGEDHRRGASISGFTRRKQIRGYTPERCNEQLPLRRGLLPPAQMRDAIEELEE